MPALNYRLSEVNAVLAIEQLKKVRALARGAGLGERLAAEDRGAAGDSACVPGGEQVSYWHGVLLVDKEEAGVGSGVRARLSAEGSPPRAPSPRNLLDWPLFRKL